MPDEDGRTQLSPLPTKGGSTNVQLPADALEESSPSDAVAAPSAEEQVSEQGTPPSTQPEKPFHMPPEERWEELRQQRLHAEERAAKAESLAQLALQKLQTPQTAPQPEVDPYAGMDAPTAEFYRQMDRRIEAKASQLAEQKLQGVLQTVDAGRRELAEIKISQFRALNPDIKPNSPEELAIAGLVQQGYDLNTAKKLALFDKVEAENRALKSKTSAAPRKAAANVEATAGIPESAGLPGRPTNWRQRAAEVIDRGGDMKDVANALFGKRRVT